jgi:hypothetical protein
MISLLASADFDEVSGEKLMLSDRLSVKRPVSDIPLRFRTRRLTLVPGLRVNVGRRVASLSIGHRNVWWTVGPRGRRAVGLPGTGLFWTENIKRGKDCDRAEACWIALCGLAARSACRCWGRPKV